MKLVSKVKMQEIDLKAQEDYGIPGLVLMEQAGQKATAFLLESFGKGACYVVLAGSGKNGGDALVVSRGLLLSGAKVWTYLIGDQDKLAEPTKINLRIYEKLGGKVQKITKMNKDLEAIFEFCDVVVDGLVGIGIQGDLKEPYLTVARLLNKADATVVALDVPTGIDATDGKILKSAIEADYTITFGLPKLGLYLYPGADYVGEVIVEALSFPPKLLNDPAILFHLTDVDEIKGLQRPENSHKGSFGKGLLVAGSYGMAGAAAFTGKAALTAGAGLIQALASRDIAAILQVLVPEMTIKDSSLNFDISEYSCLMIGPGMGVTEENAALLKKIISDAKEADIPLVLDADALSLTAKYKLLTRNNHGPVILTPHPGEMSRLTALDIETILQNRMSIALSLAKNLDAVVVLKGAHTVIALSDGSIYINPTGNAGMATAGSGDVLTGVIGGLLLQGLSPKDAAVGGVYLHGLAGDLAKEAVGARSIIASDLIEYLPDALKSVYGIN
ncbi:MAG: NAD(P)H-hydrate dehydratase [Bacillota bacterium]